MYTVELTRRYFSAWNERNAGTVLETFAPAGTYRDPITPGPIAGDRFRVYMQQLWSAFPDLMFEVGRVNALSDGIVHAEWTMRGTNTGSMQGLPPTGQPVSLPGFDVIQTTASGIGSVVGYFDSATLQRQMGLDIIVQPKKVGAVQLGMGTSMRRRLLADAQALAFTEIVAGDDESTALVRDLSRQILAEQLAGEAMMTFTSAVTGHRLTTVTTWESPEQLQKSMHTGLHAEAMSKFFSTPGILGAAIGVFTRLRSPTQLRRCSACHKVVRLMGPTGQCACGETVHALA